MVKRALITGITGQDGAYLAELLGEVVGLRGTIVFDRSKPDGTPRIALRAGIESTYRFVENKAAVVADGVR